MNSGDAIDRALSALGDATRRAVYESILLRPRRIGQVAEELPVCRASVSHHVKLLKDAGLIEERDGLMVARVEPLPELRCYFDRLWFEASVGEGWLIARFEAAIEQQRAVGGRKDA